MAYYLSKRNQEILAPLVDRLSISNGTVTLPTDDVGGRYLISLLRQGRKYFPELNRWQFRRTPTHIICLSTPKEVQMVNEVKDELNYLTLIQYIITHKPSSAKFTHVFITEREQDKLKEFCAKLNYQLELGDNIVIKK